jgi:RNA polymerase sigma-32 factor
MGASLTAPARSGFLLARHAPNLTAEREVELARAAAAGCRRSTELLVRAHIRLVYAAAGAFRSFGMPMDDLISEGMLALVIAIRRYDPERGVRLGVYALWWIRAYVRRYTISNRHPLRPPLTRNSRRLLARMRDAERKLTAAAGSPPDRHQLAADLHVQVSEVDEVEWLISGRDVAFGGEYDATAPAGQVGREATQEEDVERAEQRARVDRAVAALPPRSRSVIVDHYLAGDGKSLVAISRPMGVSRERVRQLKEDALELLRANGGLVDA